MMHHTLSQDGQGQYDCVLHVGRILLETEHDAVLLLLNDSYETPLHTDRKPDLPHEASYSDH